MSILKKIPIKYKGELHQVKLINFSVAMEEVVDLVPKSIKIRDFGGKAIISMVNVRLKKMRPSFIPRNIGFNYQHVAFRLLVDDSVHNQGKEKGIFFLKSFTTDVKLVWCGNLITNYRLSKAIIQEEDYFNLSKGKYFVRYRVNQEKTHEIDPCLKAMIQCIDRAYAVIDNKIMMTLYQISYKMTQSFCQFLHAIR